MSQSRSNLLRRRTDPLPGWNALATLPGSLGGFHLGTAAILVGMLVAITGRGQTSLPSPGAPTVASQPRRTPAATTRLAPPGRDRDVCEEWHSVIAAWRNDPVIVGCADCHYGGPRETHSPSGRSGEFSLQQELKTWLEHDKHAIARQRVEPLTQAEIDSIANELRTHQQLDDTDISARIGDSQRLSWRICDELGYDVSTTKGYLVFRDNCLTCHGGYQHGSNAVTFSSRTGFQQPGVSCNDCHQLGDNNAWVGKHGNAAAWRLLMPDEKAADGMRDLVSMTDQASLCNDCHIGNITQHRFVTHDMYAAGHPPLPSFELQTFVQYLPQHWRSPAELYAALGVTKERNKYFATYYPRLFPDDESAAEADRIAWHTRKLLTGAVQARRHSLELLVAAANSDQWGDYALYDCWACHHDLRTVSRRQQRGFPGIPGRPRETVWTRVLLTQALQVTGLRGDFDGVQRQLDAGFDERPFGNPRVIDSTARQAITQLDRAQEQLNAVWLDANAARLVAVGLTETRTGDLLEYDSARNVVWGLQQVIAELERLQPSLNASGWRLIRNLGQTGNRTLLETKLPAGQDAAIYRDFLRSEWQLRAAYLDDFNGAAGQGTPALIESQLKALREILESNRR